MILINSSSHSSVQISVVGLTSSNKIGFRHLNVYQQVLNTLSIFSYVSSRRLFKDMRPKIIVLGQQRCLRFSLFDKALNVSSIQ
jgi:hypothetical protein